MLSVVLLFMRVILGVTFSLPLEIPNDEKNVGSKVCPYGIESSVFGDSNCYIFHKLPLTFYNAEGYCEGFGGRLAIVPNGDVNQFISETAEATFGPEGEADYWLGAQSLAHQNLWQWVDGYPFVGFTNWMTGEPVNTSEERCLSSKIGSGKWFAAICYTEKSAVCTYPRRRVPPK